MLSRSRTPPGLVERAPGLYSSGARLRNVRLNPLFALLEGLIRGRGGIDPGWFVVRFTPNGLLEARVQGSADSR